MVNLDWVDTVIEEIEECQVDGICIPHKKLRSAGLLTGYRERDKHRIYVLEHLLTNLCPQPIPSVVYDVFNNNTDINDSAYSSESNYKFVNRYLKAHSSDFFHIRDVESGVREVYAKRELLDLILDSITVENQGSLTGFNRSNAQNWISQFSELTPGRRRVLAEELSEYVESINAHRLWFEVNYRGNLDISHAKSLPDSETFSLPYKTRFNSEKRLAKSFAQFNQGLEFAREEYSNAVFLTLTTDPKKHESISEMADAISKNWSRLRSWMSYESQDERRPNLSNFDYIKTLEFTEKGYPHLHVLLFDMPVNKNGKPYLCPKNMLSNRWDELGQGRIVDMQSLTYDSNLGEEYDPEEGFIDYSESQKSTSETDLDEGDESETDNISRQTAGQYLGKYLSKSYGAMSSISQWSPDGSEDSSSSDGSEDVGEDNDSISTSEIAKIALYFATRKKIWTKSQAIQEHISSYDDDDDEDDSDAEPPKFVEIEFIGCYRKGREPYRLLVESEQLCPEWLNKHKLSSSAGAENSESVPPPAEMSDFA